MHTKLKPSVSVIISVYNDLEALKLIIASLLLQSYLPNEVIIAEDAQHDSIKNYFSSLNINININIKHISHKDNGWRKEVILNKAIKISQSDYLIFIDGDCVPYKNFVEEHVKLSENNTVLCGRRTEPGNSFSSLLRNKSITIQDFERDYLQNFFKLKKDECRHIEEGIYLGSDSLLFKLLNKLKKSKAHIVGCNWSCFKSDITKINGFDEDFYLPTTGEDTDIERRLIHFGIQMKSCRNAAIVAHLYHEKIFNPEISSKMKQLMQTKQKIYICKNGLEKL